MSDRGARRLAWSAFALWISFFAGSFALDLGTKPRPGTTGGEGVDVFFILMAAFPVVAILILGRQPRNRIGWILMAIGLGWALPLGSYGEFAFSRGLPGGRLFIALSAPTWAPPIGLMGTVLLLRFPDGKLLSPRWKKVEWLAALGISLTVVVVLIAPGDLAEVGYPALANPLSVEALAPVLNALLAAIALIPITIIASAVSLVMRFRRSTGTERMQMKWLTAAGAAVAAIYAVAMVASVNAAWFGEETPTWITIIQNAAVSSFALIPIAIGFAVLKYRLYDIDVVINKALVYGALAVFITAVYVGVVVGIGTAIGSGGELNLGLQIAATALVAVAFQPVRASVQRMANRLVYGKRATPYEVMAAFGSRMATAIEVEEVLPRTAEAAARGVGAARARVRLFLPDGTDRQAHWPRDGHGAVAFDWALPVAHQGEQVGEIAVAKPAGDALRPAEEALLRDLASHAGLALHNVRLTTELRARLEKISSQAAELRESQARIVTAADDERRRLERTIEGRVERRLEQLAGRLRGALDGSDSDAVAARLEALRVSTQETLEDLREIARGIYPPLLADRGLAAALEAQARRAPRSVQLSIEGLDRYAEEIEAGVYFCSLEAIAAGGGALRLDVRDHGGAVSLTIDGELSPDAVTRIRDRIEALGGELDIDTGVLRARIPVPEVVR